MVVVIKSGCHKWYCTPTSTRQPRMAHSAVQGNHVKSRALIRLFPRPHIRREDYRAAECLADSLFYTQNFIAPPLIIHIISRRLRKKNCHRYFVFKYSEFYNYTAEQVIAS